MASLFPHLSGTMQMAALNSSSLPPSTAVPLTSGASTTVPLHFNLSRIYDNQQVADFAWKHDAFIYGDGRRAPSVASQARWCNELQYSAQTSRSIFNAVKSYSSALYFICIYSAKIDA